MDMTQAEQDGYRFRVGRMRFESLYDACIYADRCDEIVEVMLPDRSFKLLRERAGEVTYHRPGFGCFKPHPRT